MVEFTEGEIAVLERVIDEKPFDQDFTFNGLTDEVLELCTQHRVRARTLARDLGTRMRETVDGDADNRFGLRFTGRDPAGDPIRSKKNAIVYQRIR